MSLKKQIEWGEFTALSRETRNGKLKITGNYSFSGAFFRVSLSEQTNGRYRLRGRVSLLSERDGKVLQIKGARRREKAKKLKSDPVGEHPQAFAAFREITVGSTDEAEIHAKVQKAAEYLYSENILAISDDTKSICIDGLSPVQANRIHSDLFFEAQYSKVTPSTRNRRKRELTAFTAKLAAYSMGSIPQSALQRLFKEYGAQAGFIFHLAQRFWQYCAEVGVYHEKNPFDLFYEGAPRKGKKAPKALQAETLKPKSLPEDVERRLNREIQQANTDDCLTTGMLLIKDAGFPGKEACNLMWNDVIFNRIDRPETTVQFSICKENLAGATHDFTRPGTPFCARELYRRSQSALLRWGSLDGHRVLENIDGKALSCKKLNEFCRNRLLQNGMDYGSLSADMSQPYGVGVRLLLANYKAHIVYLSGFSEDSAVVKFLLGHSLSGNVTADNYRSFTSPEGQEYLLDILSRDKTFEPKIPKEALISQPINTGGETVITVKAKDPRHFNRVKATIHLSPGEHLDILAPGMLNGQCIIKKAKYS